MNIKEYSAEANKTLSHLSTPILGNIHMVLGMLTETGELADSFKKSLAYDKPIDWPNVQEEIGDLMWYIVNFCTLNNIDIEKVLDNNVKKLRARYGEKFSSEKAITRDLERERKIIEELEFK